MSLEDINRLTGRNYATLEDAQKGVAETFKFVGNPSARGTDGGTPAPTPNAPSSPPAGFVSRDEFELSNWYRDNPEIAKHRELIDVYAKANSMKPQDVVNTQFFKDAVEKFKVAEEVGSTRSTLTSNPRLGIVRDSATKAATAFESAQKARASGDVVGAQRFQQEAESAALKAVIDGFGMQNDRIVD